MLYQMSFADVMGVLDARIARNERQEKKQAGGTSNDWPAATNDDDGLEDLSHVLHVLQSVE